MNLNIYSVIYISKSYAFNIFKQVHYAKLVLNQFLQNSICLKG